MFLIDDCQSLTIVRRREEVEPEGERLEQMVIGDLNEAILEPARESLRTRRRRAAFAAVVDELDDLISDVDDE